MVLGALTIAAPASAQVGVAAPRPDEQFDFMNLITHEGLHNIDDETWNIYGQFTHISSFKLPFHAAYTNYNGTPNSLSPDFAYSETTSFTASFALKLWSGAALYVVPEVISELPLSNLHGLGGAVQDFELQKSGSLAPQLYRSRIYLEQTFDFGGERVKLDSNPQQIGTTTGARRLVGLAKVSFWSHVSPYRPPSRAVPPAISRNLRREAAVSPGSEVFTGVVGVVSAMVAPLS